MEQPWACVVGRVTDWADSAKRFLRLDRPNPIDVLKRLQRQAFYDIMQLRERQEKVERVVSLYKATKSGPFAEESTHVKGIINIAGALAINRRKKGRTTQDSSETSTSIGSRFVFQTTVRQKDTLIVEIGADHEGIFHEYDSLASPLGLSKVMYQANINDTFSVVSVPFGARCDDFATDPNLREGQCLTGFYSSLRPPLLIKRHNHAAGLIFRSKKVAISIAELISTAWKPGDAGNVSSAFSTFGQISYQAPDQTKLTVSSVWHGPDPVSIPTKRDSYSVSDTSKRTGGGCIHMELEIDEDSKVAGWMEVENSNPRLLKGAIALSDTPQGELGWGASMGGSVGGKSKQIQLESFLNFHLGKKATLQPGIVFAVEGGNCKTAVVFRSSWFL